MVLKMKKLTLIIAFLIVAIRVFSQTTVTSRALGDRIVLQVAAFEITPIIVSALGDTARSMSWVAYPIRRDTTSVFTVTSILYNKNGVVLNSIDTQVPGTFFLKWAGFITRMDNYILNQRRRLVAQ